MKIIKILFSIAQFMALTVIIVFFAVVSMAGEIPVIINRPLAIALLVLAMIAYADCITEKVVQRNLYK